MKYKLLVNNPHGEQEILEIGKTGGYSFPECVLWDERSDGPMTQDICLGAMVRIKDDLVIDKDLMAAREKKEKQKEAERAERLNELLERQKLIEEIKEKMRAGPVDVAAIQNFLMAIYDI